MASEELLVTLGVQDKGATTQIKALNKELKALDSQYKAASGTSKNFENSISGMNTKLGLLEQKYSTNQAKLTAYNNQLKKTKEAITQKTQELENLKKSEEDNAQAIAKVEKQLVSYNASLHDTENAIKLTEMQMENLKDEIEETHAKIRNAPVEAYKGKMKELGKTLSDVGDGVAKAGEKISNIGSKLTANVTMPLIGAATAAIKLGSDAEENMNKVDATFGANGEVIKKWCKTTLDQYGIASISAMEYAATVGDILKGIGFNDSELVDMSQTIISMSSDIASFKNSNPEEVFNAITAALTGEREQLKKYGYVVNDAILEEYALAKGYEKTYKEMTLQEKALLTLSKIQDYAKDATGDFAKTSDGTANSAKIFSESLKELGAAFGQDLLPTITPVVQKATELIKGFASLDEEQRKNVIQIALLAAGFGPLVSVFGKTTKGVGDVISTLGKLSLKLSATASASTSATGAITAAGKGASTFSVGLKALGAAAAPLAVSVGALAAAAYGLKEYQDMCNKSIVTAREELSPLERKFADLTGTVFRSREELEDAGVIYKKFSKDIGPEFQDAVVRMRKDIADFNLTLSETSLDGVLSEDEITALNERVTTALNGAISAIDSKTNETQEALSNLFNVDNIFSEEEKSIINWWSTRGDTEKAEAVKLQEEITAIEQTAFSEGRVLTPDEEQAILDRYAKIKQIELMAKAKNNEELLYAEIDFKNQVATLDAQGASDLMKQRLKEADDLKIQKKNEFDMLKTQVKMGYDSMSAEDKAYADRMCDELDKSWGEYLEQDQAYRDNLYNQAVESNTNLIGQINQYNGEVLKAVDKGYYDNYVAAEIYYKDLNTITETGYKKLYNSTTKTWDEVYAKVDDTTGELIGLYNLNTGEISTMTKKDGQLLANEAIAFQNTQKDIEAAMGGVKTAVVNASNQVVVNGNKISGTLKDVKDNADGTRTGILDLNGTPINVQFNKNGVISNLNDVRYAIDNIPSYKTVTIAVKGGGGLTFSSYATGGDITSNEIAYTNERDTGFELIEGNAMVLGEDSFGSLTALSAGSKVYSNTASIAMMKEEINKQLNNIGFGNYYNKNTFQSQDISRNYGSLGSNNLENLMKNMISLLTVISTKDTSLYVDSKQIAKATATSMNKELGFQNKKRW